MSNDARMHPDNGCTLAVAAVIIIAILASAANRLVDAHYAAQGCKCQTSDKEEAK